MMKWINSKGRVLVDAQTLMLTDLRRIYNQDTSELKETANLYLAYVHLVSQIDELAPYFKSDYKEVRLLTKKQLFGSKDFMFAEELDAFLDNVVEQYQEAYEETDARAERIFKKKVDDLLSKIDSTNLEIKENTGRNGTTFTSNFQILKSMMGEVMPLIDAKNLLEERVKKMNKKSVKIRGDKRESVLNKRLITPQKDD